MSARKERSDAARNREAVLTAADRLFAAAEQPGIVSMDDIAAAAGVGKGTLFRRFGDRTGLIGAVFAEHVASLREQVDNGPPPLGPETPPAERVPALLDALLRVKLANRHLSLLLEEAGSGSPYQAEHYQWWHRTLREELRQIPGLPDADFTAHALLATIRADLVGHLAGEPGIAEDRIRADVAEFAAHLLAGGTPTAGPAEQRAPGVRYEG